MKKYIYLKEGEIIQEGDEQKGLHGWMTLDGDYFGTKVRYSEQQEMHFRRPIPHTGDVQFLMCVSILVPVIVNCDGREQESIEAEAGELAYQKVLDDPRKYISYENIDWRDCKVDEVQPKYIQKAGRLDWPVSTHIEPFNTDEPKNPGKYRMLEDGEYFEDGDEEGMEDGTFKPLSPGAIGYVYDIGFGPYRRPITEPQYRPFLEGDVIEEGDQLGYNGEWHDFDQRNHGETIYPDWAKHSRKLIK